MAGYVRVDTSNNIADGNVISAADLDNEFDGVQAGFNASTGHTHGGAAGEGAPITRLGPTQDVTINASLMAPKTTNTVDLGSSSLRYKDLFLASNATIAGTLALTGIATFTAQPILSSLTASRAVFTDGAKGLVSNALTGTGNVVMSVSPTLTGTISAEALTLSGAVTATGGTANGVAYLNGSKVLTTGSALTFDGTNFKTTGYAKAGGFTVAAGTLTAFDAASGGLYGYYSSGGVLASYSNNSGTLSPLNFDGSYLAWRPAGSEQMRLTSTGLGIGTSSPGQRLDVNGDARIGNATAGTNRVLQINGVVNKASRIAFQESGVDRWLIGNGAASENGNFEIFDATTGNNFVMTRSGNLGLGVTPSAWDTTNRKVLQIGAGSGGTIHFAGSSINSVFSNNYYFNGTNVIYQNNGAAQYYAQLADGSHSWNTAPSGTAGNAISFTQALTLDASGFLMLGTTTALRRFTVESTTPQIALRNSNSAAGKRWDIGADGSSNAFVVYNQSSVGVFINDGATSWTANSDERIKDIIEPITNAAQKVSTLRAVIGKYKTDEASVRRSFLIAQDVQAVLPEAVSVRPDEMGTLGVQYTEVIPLLVAAIKELKAEFDAYKAAHP